MPTRVATQLADGRVMACEAGRRYVFDPSEVDDGVEAGPRLDDEESLDPLLFAQPNGDALIVTEVTSTRDRESSRRTLRLLWSARSGVLQEVADFGAWVDGTVVRVGPDLYVRLGGATLNPPGPRPPPSLGRASSRPVAARPSGPAPHRRCPLWLPAPYH